jgi:hypothetical protein
MVYKNTLATVKGQIQQVENPMPAVIIRVEAACVGNAILFDNKTFEVALEEPEIRTTHPSITIDMNCPNNEAHIRMAGGIGDY